VLAWGLASALLAVSPRAAAQLPEWMEHWEFGLNIEEDDGPDYFADLILPLYRHPEDERVLFFEPRVRYADGEALYNVGWGARELVQNRTWLLGTNLFWDYETQHSHYRLGWGLEALSAFAEARTNFYLALSQQRIVQEDGENRVIEEAVDGFDFELGAPAPYYSKVKVFGGFNWYNFEKFENRYGWTLRTEYTPWPCIVIDGLMSDDTKGNFDWGMTVAFRLPLGGNEPAASRSPLQLDETMFPDGDAGAHLFRLVERRHEIVVERRRETAGISVEVGRGT